MKKEVVLQKKLVERKDVFWRTIMRKVSPTETCNKTSEQSEKVSSAISRGNYARRIPNLDIVTSAPSGKSIPLYEVAHSRAGDKGNDLNFSIIPYFPPDVKRLKKVITPNWVKNVVAPLLDVSPSLDPHDFVPTNDKLKQVTVEIYDVSGIHSLNVVVRNILDGGVNCSRRIDRHGKTISDLILCHEVVLPS